VVPALTATMVSPCVVRISPRLGVPSKARVKRVGSLDHLVLAAIDTVSDATQAQRSSC